MQTAFQRATRHGVAVIAAAALALTGAGVAVAAPDDTPGAGLRVADPGASAQTLSLFDYLADSGRGGILFGQQHAVTESYSPATTGPDGESLRSDVYAGLSDLPAVFGFDTLALRGEEKPGVEGASSEENVANLAAAFVRADALGAIPTLSAHMPNFVTGGRYNDTEGRVVSQILPGGEKNADYNAYLDLIAATAKSSERTDGTLVPIIFRPFHESNGSWFWWGAAHTSSGEIQEIFRYTVEYLRDVKGVNNFLYSWSPNGTFAGDASRYLATYPGDDFVDILGYDAYEGSEGGGTAAWSATIVNDLRMIVTQAEARGKVAAFTEFGRNGDRAITASGNAEIEFFTTLFDAIHSDSVASKIAYMQTWANFPGQYYVPPPAYGEVDAHDMWADFAEFAADDATLFASDLDLADVHGRTVTAAPHASALRLVSPAAGVRITDTTVTVRAKATGPGADTATATFTALGTNVPLTLDAATGFLTGTWEIDPADLSNATRSVTLTGTVGGEEFSDDTLVVLGDLPTFPRGTIDDFEGYGDDDALRAAWTTNNAGSEIIALADRGSDGQGVTYSYDFTSRSYQGFGRAYAPAQNFSGFEGLGLTVGSDGSGHKLVVQIKAGGISFEAYPSLATAGTTDVQIPWTEFAPAPWDTANAGAQLTQTRLARVTEYFTYLNDGGESLPRTGDLVIDDIVAYGEGEFVDPGTGAVEPALVDNFDSYEDTAALQAAWGNNGIQEWGDGLQMELAPERGTDGSNAAAFVFDLTDTGLQRDSRWYGGTDWAGRTHFSGRIDVDGATQGLLVQFRTPSNPGGGEDWFWNLPVVVNPGEGWQDFSLAFDDAVVSWPEGVDPDARPTATQLARINEVMLGVTLTDGEGAKTGTIYLDDLRADGATTVPEPEIEDAAARVLDDFESYADDAAVATTWNNRGAQDWADGIQLGLAPTGGSNGSKAGAFRYDLTDRSDNSEAQWLGGASFAGLEGIGLFVDPQGSTQRLVVQVRTPAGDGGDDWFWDLPVTTDGTGPQKVFLSFDDARVTYPAGVADSERLTKKQLASIMEFVLRVDRLDDAAPTGTILIDDLRVGAPAGDEGPIETGPTPTPTETGQPTPTPTETSKPTPTPTETSKPEPTETSKPSAAASTVKLSPAMLTTRAGVRPTWTVTVKSAGAVDGGTVTLRAGTTKLGTAKVVRGTAKVKLSAAAVARVGNRNVVASFAGTKTAAAGSAKGTLRVVRATAKVKVTSLKTTVGARPVIKVKVTSTVAPTGRVDVYAGKKKVGTAKVTKGVARVKLAKSVTTKPGKVALTVKYRGSAQVAPKTTKARLAVAKARTRVGVNAPAMKVGQDAYVKVSVRGTGGQRPSGKVVIRFDGRPIATVNLSGTSSKATFTVRVRTSRVGQRTITATYSGNAKLAQATGTDVTTAR
ncbi:Ig-like domain repeat protein [Flavimobilis sp. GY10621]|uniref:Ig-like domain repeat protein n=1 Tax=Flavimobilis rhizosphaerae TaxID=2775421 RepID=A0ABR9DPI7_9MICO|nr:glycosyl hydrolase [Flavimobilis rhizosphaerae]MBD9699030.1 Ig-like domain repeat protein [Flavimobilis rhizosphaerae]